MARRNASIYHVPDLPAAVLSEDSPSPIELDQSSRNVSIGRLFPRALGVIQKLSHFRISNRRLAQRVSMDRPPRRSPIPSIVASRQIDAVVDQELRRFIFPANRNLMQDTGWFMRAPRRIHIGAVLQEELRNLKMPVHDRPSERYVQDVLRIRWIPMQ